VLLDTYKDAEKLPIPKQVKKEIDLYDESSDIKE
jgi:hypothetical protein